MYGVGGKIFEEKLFLLTIWNVLADDTAKNLIDNAGVEWVNVLYH
jgi:hypothetical protein